MKIKLFNRDGANLWLEQYTPEHWKLNCDEEHKWVLEYMRVGYDNENSTEYSFIDPSGGPFITPGYEVIDEDGNKFIVHCIDKPTMLIHLDKKS